MKQIFTTIVLMLLIPAGLLMAQKTAITGTIRELHTLQPLPGATVVIAGTTIGTVADVNGEYLLEVKAGTISLTISFIGYESISRSVTIAHGQILTFDFSLSPDIRELEELVVVGYGVQPKSVVTGAITSVRARDLENMPITRIEQALQGRTSGMTIAASSGQPGASSTVRVRGTTTINNSDPLYVIDGVPVDVGGIDFLNVSDIESIEVLKDAASAAIYGARAASGVILITTKRGQAGEMRVNYNSFFGTQAPARKLDLLNATEYAELRNESRRNAGMSILFPDPAALGEGTDWQSVIFNNNAAIQNHELSISGGNERSTFFTSFGYIDQEGIVATDISRYTRLNLRFNSAHKINEWLKIGNNLGYSHIKSRGALNTNSEFGGPLSSAINLDPITPLIITDSIVANQAPYSNQPVVRDPDGNPYGISRYVVQEMTNPMAYIATVLGNFGWSDNFVGNVYAEVKPIKGLRFRSDLGTKLSFWGGEGFSPVVYLNAASSVTRNSFNKSTNQGLIWNLENTLAYEGSIGKHNFTGLIGTSAFVANSKGINATYFNLPVNTFDEASMNYSVTTEDLLGGGWESPDHRVSSIFGRLIYNYDEKYLFTGILRRDGSSRFGTHNRFGYFPSVSAGWVVTRENFWPENDIVNFLKIRGSYGVTGNDNIGDFQYLATVGGGRNYTFGTGNYLVGYSPNAPSNPELKWEETSQANLGFELTMFEELRLVFDVYSKNTTGMLQPIILPAYIGAVGSPTGNIASMTNKGFEVELSYRKRFGDLDLELRGNTSYLVNEITDLGGVDFRTGAFFHGSTYEISRLMVGYPIGVFYGFEVLGVFQSAGEIQNHVNADGALLQPNARPGDFRYNDVNADGVINDDDRTFIGDPTPTWSYGLTVSGRFRGFDLLVFAQGVSGNDIYNALRRLDIPAANWTSAALGRWNGVGTSTTFPRIVEGDPNKNFNNPSSFHLSPGDYIRIKTIQIGYTIPRALAARAGLEQFRVYVSALNPLTFTQYNGFDPEIGGWSFGIDRGFYPQARSFMIGVNVGI